jgi:hypothetical protein
MNHLAYTRSHYSFRGCDLPVPVIFETNIFGLAAVPLSRVVSSLRKRLHRDSSPGGFFFWLWRLFLVISSSKHNTFAWCPSILLTSELQGLPHRHANLGHYFRVLTFQKSLPDIKARACEVWSNWNVHSSDISERIYIHTSTPTT